MAMNAPPAFLRALELQRKAYGKTLPERIELAASLWSLARDNPDAGKLESLVRVAHGLAGSGAVFGYTQLGIEARALEKELSVIRAGGSAPHRAAMAAIDASLVRLRGCSETRDECR